MAEPNYYAEGTAMRSTDTGLRKWTKVLGVKQNEAGAKAANNPRRGDTMRIIKLKLLHAYRGTSYG